MFITNFFLKNSSRKILTNMMWLSFSQYDEGKRLINDRSDKSYLKFLYVFQTGKTLTVFPGTDFQKCISTTDQFSTHSCS